ncbi:uncharacterized protein LOC135323894 isoform X2 [Dromaius novaehollandiae]
MLQLEVLGPGVPRARAGPAPGGVSPQRAADVRLLPASFSEAAAALASPPRPARIRGAGEVVQPRRAGLGATARSRELSSGVVPPANQSASTRRLPPSWPPRVLASPQCRDNAGGDADWPPGTARTPLSHCRGLMSLLKRPESWDPPSFPFLRRTAGAAGAGRAAGPRGSREDCAKPAATGVWCSRRCEEATRPRGWARTVPGSSKGSSWPRPCSSQVAEFSQSGFERPNPSDRFKQRLEMFNATALRIRALEPGDSGIYGARVILHPAVVQDQSFNLSIYEPLPDPEIQSWLLSETPAQCNVSLRCRVPSGTRATVTWVSPHGDPQGLRVRASGGGTLSVEVQPGGVNTTLSCSVRGVAEERRR